MKRKKPPEEHENLERWLVSYADFITLLFAFFTTLYAISTVDAKKMGKMVLSMQAAFDPTGFSNTQASRVSVTGGGGSAPVSASFIQSLMNKPQVKPAGGSGDRPEGGGDGDQLARIKDDISNLILDEALRDKVQIVIKSRGVVISLAEAGFFNSGQHKVRRESLKMLDKIVGYLRKLPNPIRITGHSDNQRIRTRRFPSNWELSTARAAGIVTYLVETHKFNPNKLAAAGYGEHRPVASNDTAEGRARNRRVDIVIPSMSVKNLDPDNLD
jgi:chemotaxis protein MotB